MKDKEIIEEMAEDLIRAVEYDIENSDLIDSYATAIKLTKLGWIKPPKDSVVYQDGKIYYNGEHIGYIEFSFYEDIKALGFGNFKIIDKRKGYGTLVIKDIIHKYKNKESINFAKVLLKYGIEFKFKNKGW